MVSEHKFLLDVLRGDTHAVAFIEALFGIFQTWDDLIDGDPTTQERIHEAFTHALVTLPRNPFWQRFAPELQPIIEAAIVDWQTANRFERGNRDDQVLAFVLRERVAQIVVRAAWCLGGQRWAEEVAPSVWRANQDGTLEHYLGGLP